MTAIQDLIAKQQEINNPPAEPAPLTPLQKQIEKAKAEYENPTWEPMQVILAGELVTLEVAHAWREWGDLEAAHPAQEAEDRAKGYNPRTLPRDYPVDRLKVNGEHIPQEVWADLYDVLPPEHQENVSVTMWGLNVYEPQQRLAAVKAKAEQ